MADEISKASTRQLKGIEATEEESAAFHAAVDEMLGSDDIRVQMRAWTALNEIEGKEIPAEVQAAYEEAMANYNEALENGDVEAYKDYAAATGTTLTEAEVKAFEERGGFPVSESLREQMLRGYRDDDSDDGAGPIRTKLDERNDQMIRDRNAMFDDGDVEAYKRWALAEGRTLTESDISGYTARGGLTLFESLRSQQLMGAHGDGPPPGSKLDQRLQAFNKDKDLADAGDLDARDRIGLQVGHHGARGPGTGTGSGAGTGSGTGAGSGDGTGGTGTGTDRGVFGDTQGPMGGGAGNDGGTGTGAVAGTGGTGPSEIDVALDGLRNTSSEPNEIPSSRGQGESSTTGLSMPGGVGTQSDGVPGADAQGGASQGQPSSQGERIDPSAEAYHAKPKDGIEYGTNGSYSYWKDGVVREYRDAEGNTTTYDAAGNETGYHESSADKDDGGGGSGESGSSGSGGSQSTGGGQGSGGEQSTDGKKADEEEADAEAEEEAADDADADDSTTSEESDEPDEDETITAADDAGTDFDLGASLRTQMIKQNSVINPSDGGGDGDSGFSFNNEPLEILDRQGGFTDPPFEAEGDLTLRDPRVGGPQPEYGDDEGFGGLVGPPEDDGFDPHSNDGGSFSLAGFDDVPAYGGTPGDEGYSGEPG